MIKYSVIVPVYNRPDEVEELSNENKLIPIDMEQMEFMQKALLYGGTLLNPFPKGFDFEKSYSHDQLFKSVLKYGNFIVCPSVMMKRDIVEKTNKFNFDMFKTSSDLGLWLNLTEYGNFAFLESNLIN